MKPSLFRSGFTPRLLASAIYGVAAFGAIALVHDDAAAPRPTTESNLQTSKAAESSATLVLESTHPVSAWVVQIDGNRINGDSLDETRWKATTPVRSTSSVLIEAQPKGDRSTSNAIRIRIAGITPSRDQTFWLERDWTVATTISNLDHSRIPLEGGDLP